MKTNNRNIDERFYRDSDRYYHEEERYDRFGRDCSCFGNDYDDDDDIGFDYCENAGDSCTGNGSNGNGSTGNGNNCGNGCNSNCNCHNNCECNDSNNNNCECNWNDCCIDDKCCHDNIHCSERCDYNEDEHYGCRVVNDAANSEDDWFDNRTENTYCFREREVNEEECRFCKKLLCRIQVLDFALNETIQFLNTHPCDCEALRYYCQIRKKLERAERLYERKCGPLTSKGVDTEYGWEWATCPWPWEGR